MELVESAARKVREKQFKETQAWGYSSAEDVFRCDYPVRHFIDKAREAERRVAELEAELEKHNAPPSNASNGEPQETDKPF